MKVARFPSGAFKVTRGWVQRVTSRKIVTDPPGSVYPQASSGDSAGSKAPWWRSEVALLTAGFRSAKTI